MHRLFGTSKPSSGGKDKKAEGDDKEESKPKPTLGSTVAGMDVKVKELDTKIKTIDQELMRYKEQLKRAAPSAKASIQKRAMATLKRKRMYEQQRDSMASQSFNIEQTAFAIESIANTHIAVQAMKDATVTLKEEHEKIDIDAIEDMQDDLADIFDEQDEIQDIMGRSYGVPDGVDEDDLDAELAGLDDEFEGIELEDDVSAPVQLPNNPTIPTTVFNGGTPVANDAQPQQGSRQAVDEFNLPV